MVEWRSQASPLVTPKRETPPVDLGRPLFRSPARSLSSELRVLTERGPHASQKEGQTGDQFGPLPVDKAAKTRRETGRRDDAL